MNSQLSARRRRFRLLSGRNLLVALFVLPLFAGALSAQQRIGLVIGTNYKGNAAGIPPLDLCESDARLMEDSLKRNGGFTDVKVLLGQMVTAKNVEDAINYVAGKAGRDDTVVLYFSGHGTYGRDASAPNGIRNFVVMYDRPHVPDNQLNDWVKRIRTPKLVWVFDCCYSGGIANKGRRGTGEVPTEPGQPGAVIQNGDENFYFEDKAIVASSDSNETSIEVRGNINHGIFTYYFAQGLIPRNGDMNQDGTVTLLEAFEWSKPRVVAEARKFNHRQTPQISGRASGILIAGNITPTPPRPQPEPVTPQPEPVTPQPEPGPTPPDMPDPVTPAEPEVVEHNDDGSAIIYTTILKSIAAGPTPMDPMTLIMRNRRGNEDRRIAVKFSGEEYRTRITWLNEAQLRQQTGEQIPLGFYSYRGQRFNNQVARIDVSGIPTGVHEIEIIADGYPVINQRLGVERTAQNNKLFVVASLSGFGSIQGKVFFRNFDTPLAGQEIWMPTVVGTNQQHKMRSTSDGSFWFLNLPAGDTYFIKASFLESTPLDNRYLSVEEGKATQVDIVLKERLDLRQRP
jgi:uncharacterized caspase-like protein